MVVRGPLDVRHAGAIGNDSRAASYTSDRERSAMTTASWEWFAEDGGSTRRLQAQLRGTPAPGDKVRNPKRKRGFGEWANSTIYSILRDPVYRGVYYADAVR